MILMRVGNQETAINNKIRAKVLHRVPYTLSLVRAIEQIFVSG